MRNIYIDLGCFDGDTVRTFLKQNSDKKWWVYGFDPNPNFRENWDQLADDLKDSLEEINMSNAAAWISDGSIPFTLRPADRPYGSTIMQNKRDWGDGTILDVECFDFSQWLNQFRGDHVVVKLNCEGAEYEILEKMIVDGSTKLVDLLMVEFHDNKLTGDDYSSRRLGIIKNFKMAGVEIEDWK